MAKQGRWIALTLGILFLGLSLQAQQPRPKYTIEEYNDYTAAVNEENAQARVRALDSFLQKYPESALRPFVFQTYIQTYQQAQNWAKVVESADKFLALDPAVVEEVSRQPNLTEEQVKQQVELTYYQNISLRARAFLLSFEDKGAQSDAAAEKAAALAREGLQRLERLARPANLTQEQFDQVKRQEAAVFQSVLGAMAFRKKDYAAAARSYETVVAQDPNNAFYTYRLGLSYLQASQPRYLPGLWAVARAAALFPENQRKSVRDFLVGRLRAYQAFADLCPAQHVEHQADELIARAKSQAKPAPDWKLPDGEHVMAVRNDLTVKRIFDELKADGEQRQVIWVASCGMELPDLPGKVVGVDDSGDNLVTLRLAVGEEAADADTPNVEVKVKEPPEARNLKPGDIIRVSGVLTDFHSEPFLLRLAEGRVNPEDIPKGEAPAPRRRPRSSR